MWIETGRVRTVRIGLAFDSGRLILPSTCLSETRCAVQVEIVRRRFARPRREPGTRSVFHPSKNGRQRPSAAGEEKDRGQQDYQSGARAEPLGKSSPVSHRPSINVGCLRTETNTEAVQRPERCGLVQGSYPQLSEQSAAAGGPAPNRAVPVRTADRRSRRKQGPPHFRHSCCCGRGNGGSFHEMRTPGLPLRRNSCRAWKQEVLQRPMRRDGDVRHARADVRLRSSGLRGSLTSR